MGALQDIFKAVQKETPKSLGPHAWYLATVNEYLICKEASVLEELMQCLGCCSGRAWKAQRDRDALNISKQQGGTGRQLQQRSDIQAAEGCFNERMDPCWDTARQSVSPESLLYDRY